MRRKKKPITLLCLPLLFFLLATPVFAQESATAATLTKTYKFTAASAENPIIPLSGKSESKEKTLCG